MSLPGYTDAPRLKANWSGVLHFYNQTVNGQLTGSVTLYSWDDWSSFSADIEQPLSGDPNCLSPARQYIISDCFSACPKPVLICPMEA
jgi:hypothetical protein